MLVMCEYELKRGVRNGSETYWHENGNRVESRKLDSDDSNLNYKMLLKFREQSDDLKE